MNGSISTWVEKIVLVACAAALAAGSALVAGCDDEADGDADADADGDSDADGDGDVDGDGDADSDADGDVDADGDADGDVGDVGYRDEWANLERGALAEQVPITAQVYHDVLAAGGEPTARALGDQSHDVLLGADIMGSPVGQFLALDRWDNTEGPAEYYSAPGFAEAIGALFDADGPTIEQFEQVDWFSYGDVNSADGDEPFWWVVVRGTLAGGDLAASQAAHDALAAAGQAAAEAAGNVGHVVYLGLEPAMSPFEFLAIDVWTDSANIADFYAGLPPEFGELFTAPPVVAVYESSSFYQYDSGVSPDPEIAVMVRGGLAEQVPVPAAMYHDIVAGGGEEAARAAGNLTHNALLGTALMGSPEGAFLGFDRWDDLDAMTAFYANPDFIAALIPLFAAPPVVEQFEAVDWFGWGDVDSGDATDPYFWVVVRGTLAGDDLVAARAAHDALAEGGSAAAQAAGNVAHLAFLGLPGTDAEMEFLAIDVWNTSDGLEAFYAALPPEFGELFAAPPVVAVYESTAFVQW